MAGQSHGGIMLGESPAPQGSPDWALQEPLSSTWRSCQPSQGAPVGMVTLCGRASTDQAHVPVWVLPGMAKPRIQETGISPSSSISQQLLLPVPCPRSPAFPGCRVLYTLVNTSKAEPSPTPSATNHPPTAPNPGHSPTLPWGCSGLVAQPHSPSTLGRDTPWTCSRPRVHQDPRLDPVQLLSSPSLGPSHTCFSPSPGCVCP